MYMYTVTRRIYCTVAVRCILRVLWLDFELVVGTSVVAWRQRERHQRLLRCRRERRRGAGGRSAHVDWGWVFCLTSQCDLLKCRSFNVVTTYSRSWRHVFDAVLYLQCLRMNRKSWTLLLTTGMIWQSCGAKLSVIEDWTRLTRLGGKRGNFSFNIVSFFVHVQYMIVRVHWYIGGYHYSCVRT